MFKTKSSAKIRWRETRTLRSRLPELSGVLWLATLAGAIWKHTHFAEQAPITDSFSYYAKAYYFWEAVHAGRWFNPLNLDPIVRPPGTILMSYPFGFDPDPRGFYFRSVYFPACLLFSSVLIVAYRIGDDVNARWRTVLTAVFFTTLTLFYHFELSAGASGFWGLVDGFLTGLAALAAACVWRGAREGARTLAWAVAVGLVSSVSILVKPSGTFVAAIAGIAWVAFALGELAGRGGSDRGLRGLALRFFWGAALIGLTDAAVVAAALGSRYFSSDTFAWGQASIAIMRAEFQLPLSQLWAVLNTSLGRAFLAWGALVALIYVWALLFHRSVFITARHLIALAASVAALAFGVWFWFSSSGGFQPRYAMPFFAMGMIWLVPVAMRASHFAPVLLKLSISGVAVVAALNLVLLLLLPQPSFTWQQLAGVNVTAGTFPRETVASFRRLAAQFSPPSFANVYVASLDENDWILDSIANQAGLLHRNLSLSLRRPIDWVRPSTFRVAEIAAADILLINPEQARPAPAGSAIRDLSEEQGVLTAWADKLDASDGVSIFFSSPSTKILSIVEPVKFSESLRRFIAQYRWDATFAEANHLRQ